MFNKWEVVVGRVILYVSVTLIFMLGMLRWLIIKTNGASRNLGIDTSHLWYPHWHFVIIATHLWCIELICWIVPVSQLSSVKSITLFFYCWWSTFSAIVYVAKGTSGKILRSVFVPNLYVYHAYKDVSLAFLPCIIYYIVNLLLKKCSVWHQLILLSLNANLLRTVRITKVDGRWNLAGKILVLR